MDEILMRRPLDATLPEAPCDGFTVAWRADASAYSQIWSVPESSFHRGFTSCCAPEDLARRQALLAPAGGGDAVGVGIAWRNVDADGKEVGWVHSLRVDEACRGRGLAKVLLVAVLGRLAGE